MNNLAKDLLIGLQPAHLVTMILLILLAGCDYQGISSDVRKSLNLAGGNNKELLEVIHHYKQTDHEKLQAAYYLISNMPGHYSIGGQGIFDPAFDKIMPLLKESGATSDNGAVFTNLIDSIRFNSRTTFTAEPDIRFIDAGYLIENIDLAYQAYSMIPEHLKYNSGHDQEMIETQKPQFRFIDEFPQNAYNLFRNIIN